MDVHSKDCRHDMRLSWCTQAINFPQQRIWFIDYWSLSLLSNTSYHRLQHCIFCIATLRNQRKRWVIQTQMQLHQNINLTTQSHDINQTWCLCHPQHLPSHQGRRKQVQMIYQCERQAGGTPCICWLFVPGEWMKLNSNVGKLNVWCLTKVWWDVSLLRIKMGVWKAMIIRMKKGSNHQEKRRARWQVLCGIEGYTEGIGRVQNKKESQI